MSLVGGNMRHGRHRRWILVMVPIDVTNFDDGRRRRGVAYSEYVTYLLEVLLYVASYVP
jgi:hypothetical protein